MWKAGALLAVLRFPADVVRCWQRHLCSSSGLLRFQATQLDPQ